MDHSGDVAKVKVLEQAPGLGDVAVVRVPVEVRGLVGAPEAGVVRRDAAVAGVANGRDHLAPQVGPGRLAVEEHHRGPVALVEVGESEPIDLAVVRLEREAREAFEALVRGAKGLRHEAAIACAVLWASAMIVTIGLTPEAVGKALASPIHTPGVSWSSPIGFATLVSGSRPIRQLPIWWAVKIPNSRGASEWAVMASVNASRSSPRSQIGALRPIVTMRSAPAASCRRISSASPRRK